MPTRAKFKCSGVTKSVGHSGVPFVYGAKFSAVYGDSEENKKFFVATPSGQIDISTIREDVFEPGKEYYVDFTEVE